MAVRLWIVGEGNNELGMHDGYGGRERGVLDGLLQKVCPAGWSCARKLQWSAIRKYRAGGARGGPSHGDYWNVIGLVFGAYEDACEVAVFARDVDSEPARESAVAAALRWIATESDWRIDVVGGVAKPAIEGWILALHGVRDTNSMTRPRTIELLVARGIDVKSSLQYLDVVDAAVLREPAAFGLAPGTESLQSWLATAHAVLNRLVHGA